MSSKKDALLGMPMGTAAGRWRKAVMFDLVRRLGENICYRCGSEIASADVLSIEHKDAWERADDPVATFFSLENIGFSHLSCNIGAAFRPNKVYPTYTDARRANAKRNQKNRIQQTKRWRTRRREAGLPYT